MAYRVVSMKFPLWTKWLEKKVKFNCTYMKLVTQPKLVISSYLCSLCACNKIRKK